MIRPARFSAAGLAAYSLAAALMAFITLPLIALAWRALGLAGRPDALRAGTVIDALLLSLGTTALSLLITLTLGTPLAYLLGRRSFPLKPALLVLLELPIVMPPVVAGLALLSAFGRRGLIGAPLAELGIQFTFTPLAVVLAQVFVAAPFYVRAAQARFSVIPAELESAARIDGANGWQVFRQVMLPLAAPGMLAGAAMSWARALGEFGATILFAGSLPGRTQTMTLLVYAALERDLRAAFTSALILLGLAAAALLAARLLTRLEVQEDVLAGPG